MADTKTLPTKRFASSAAWDAWLRKHHATSPGVWLEFAKKGLQSPPLSHAQALETALCYGWIDGQTASSTVGWWRQRFTRRGPRSKWSKINCAAVDRLQAEGRLTPAGLEQVEAAKRDGRWKAAYASQRTITIPRDLQAALAASPRGKEFFQALDSKNRYAILYRLQDAKRAETRQRRLQKFVQMLEAGETLHELPIARSIAPGGAGMEMAYRERWEAETATMRRVLAGFPMEEERKWGKPTYCVNGKNVVILQGFKEYFGLGFFQGALLKDPKRVLVQLGQVHAGRVMKFSSVKDIVAKAATIKAYVREAIAVEKAGLRMEPKKTSDLEVPEELTQRFRMDPRFKRAFQALTPGRQRGYLYYFAAAKQSATRVSRIKKAMPAIFEGRGFLESPRSTIS